MDQSGLPWPSWPVAGAVGAGRQDALPEVPVGFTLTPSARAELENTRQILELLDVPAELIGQEASHAGPDAPG